jgi:hypothetical protein
MASPQGFFIQLDSSLEPGTPFGYLTDWFDEIFQVFGEPGSPNHIETMIITNTAKREANGPISLAKDSQGAYMLDRIKDYLPKFDYLFFCGSSNVYDLDIAIASSRSANINYCRDASNLFIQYLQENDINKPIHWYIDPEADLNWFNVNNYNLYISEYIEELTNLSHDNSLNEPEFLWSPFFAKYPHPTPLE